MNTRIILALSVLIGAHSIVNGVENRDNKMSIALAVARLSKTIYEKIGKPLLENKVLNENKALKTLIWSSLGTISATMAYRTMRDIYYEKPDRNPNPILGDKILMTIICYIFAADNLLTLYKSYK